MAFRSIQPRDQQIVRSSSSRKNRTGVALSATFSPISLSVRQPLGITIMGGLVVSQLLTLCTTPMRSTAAAISSLDKLPGADGALDNCSFHFIERSSAVRLNHTFQLRRGDLRQDYDAAIRMHEELNSVARPEMKMIPNGLGNRGLSFYTKCGFHCVSSLHFTECNTIREISVPPLFVRTGIATFLSIFRSGHDASVEN